MNITLSLAGGPEQLDTLYAACSLYAMKQSQMYNNALVPEEKDLALLRLSQIKDIILQLDSLPAITT